jgi:hypothetical protein
MNPEQRAVKVAEAATDVWWRHGRAGTDSAAIGVIAALALLAQADPNGPDPRRLILGATDGEIADLLAEVWITFTITRPELALRCGPFAAWLDEQPRQADLTATAAAVARGALNAGVLDLTLDPEVSAGVDVLGAAYQAMRPSSAKRAHGEFYTPPELALMIAQMMIADIQPGQSICEPAAGTGGMLRAAAQVMRERGLDPAAYRWYAADISPAVVAGLAVNAHLWRLGPNVVIGCADTLAERDWHVRAATEQRKAIARQRQRLELAQIMATIRQAEALITRAVGSDGEEAA